MAFNMPDIFKITVKGACPSHGRTDVRARKHTVIIDEPPSRGGTDLGASPLETLLASFAGCTNVIATAIAEEMELDFKMISVDITGSLDTRGFRKIADVSVPFPEVEMTVDVVGDLSESQLEELKSDLAKRCPVSVIFREAGTRITETWNVTKP
jgi:uncharacterized OsmC-like protein